MTQTRKRKTIKRRRTGRNTNNKKKRNSRRISRRQRRRTRKNKHIKKGGGVIDLFRRFGRVFRRKPNDPCNELRELRREASDYTKEHGLDNKSIVYYNKIRSKSRIYNC